MKSSKKFRVYVLVCLASIYGCSHLPSGQGLPGEQATQQKQLANDDFLTSTRPETILAHQPAPQVVAEGKDLTVSPPFETDPMNDMPESGETENQERLSLVDVSAQAEGIPLLEGQAAPSLMAEQPKTASEDDVGNQSKLDEALDFCDLAQSFWQKGELENALEALDKAYYLIVDVNLEGDANLIQQKEDLRFLISKRILEIYASRNIVVNGNHDEIPLAMNRHVEAELKRFSNGERAFFQQSYQRSGIYRPYIVDELRKAGIPEELSWLPLIESGFKVKALSSARALGLWQFIPSTGYKFGLQRNQYIDERMDFVKATHAAIAYLKELHSIFGDWSTVLAAYNCGEGRVLQVIRTQNVNYLDNFWDLYERLPLETARYVPRFLATLHMVRNPEQYGLDQLVLEQPFDFETVEINREVHLKSISTTTGIDLEQLKNLNPELRHELIPPENYTLRVPAGKTLSLMAQIDNIPISRLPQQTTYAWHRVTAGETLSSIARRYRTSIASITRANNLKSSSLIRVGTRLKIPHKGGSVAVQNASPQRSPIPSSGIHQVRKGDSLWIIANQYGTDVKDIMAMNDLSSSHLYIGQSLKIPGFKRDPLPDISQLKVYLVKSGDSPYTIAQKHNMALERLLRINQLSPSSKIYPGQRLIIE